MRYLYAIILSLVTFSAARAVTANFTVDYSSGCSPLVVHFTNTSTGATSYMWNLGNSVTTSATNPSTSYLAVGTYTVTLTATGAGGSDVKTMVITVHPNPTVVFAASDTTVCPGAPVTFSNSSTSGGTPGPLTYVWNFGDGASSTSPTPTHAYIAPGNYNVSLQVTNAQGCTRLLTRTSYIEVYNPPDANFYGSPVNICTPPGTVNFTNTSTGPLPMSYIWTFGVGLPSTAYSPSVTYSTPGVYTVKLVVTDGFGCKDSITRPAYIYVGSLSPSFTTPTAACEHSILTFPNTSSTHTSRVWNYGDGSGSDTSYNGSHAYASAGTYVVSLTIYGGPCSAVVTHTVTVTPPPTGTFSISPAFPCPPPVTLAYPSTTPPGTTVTWLYEGGATGSGPTGSHTYTWDGIKVVKMVITDAMGCADTVARVDTIYDLRFAASADPREGCAPLNVSFSTFLTSRWPDTTAPPQPYPFPVSSYSWDFGDGSGPGSGPSPSHVYTAAGIYLATVTATTANGCIVTDTVEVRVGTPPVVTFSVTASHICYGGTVTFVATVISGPVTKFEWATGDGLFASSTGTYTHTYTLPGTFVATLTPYYNGCPGAPVTVGTTIVIDSPKAIIGFDFMCSPETGIQFYDRSLGATTRLWMFGDGTTSTVPNPMHVYSALGTYTVTLATHNATSGCRDTAVAVIHVVNVPIDFVASDTTVCKFDTVRFSAIYPPGAKPDTLRWYVNGVTKPWWNDTTMTDTFTAGGFYTVMLAIVNSRQCRDTVIKTNYISVGDPDASFSVGPLTGCAALTATFTDASSDVPGIPIPSFFWKFGDGTTSTVATPTTTHTYTGAGTYPVKLFITDANGCVDSAGPTVVTAWRPVAAFTASNTHPCINSIVNFSNTSTGYVSCFWSFGDGSTSTATTPAHAYADTGTYTVRLIVTDSHGCSDTLTRPAYIQVTKPHAAFTMSDTFSVCPPILVTFTNASTGATGYSWTFGDGNISALVSPVNLYNTPGAYPVTLIATNAYGCKDTAYSHLTLFGYAGALSYDPLTGCVPHLVHFSAAISNVPTIIWDFGDGSTSLLSNVDTASHLYTLPGTYLPKLILSDFTGCQNSVVGPFTIKVDQLKAKIDVFPASCIGSPFNLVDSTSWYFNPPTSWYWRFGSDTSTLASPVHPAVNTLGTVPVTLVVSNAWGCTDSITADITIRPLPTVTASGDTVVCVTDAATLFGYGANTYSWSGPAGTLGCTECNPANATPTVPSTYTVIGTDIYGCKDTTTVNVGLRTHTFAAASGDTAICNGMQVPIVDTGGTKYLWQPPGGLSSNIVGDPLASPGTTVTYTVVAQIGSCIPDTDYVKITVYPLPTVDAGRDQEALAGTPVQLEATGTNIAAFSWAPAKYLDCTDCAAPEATVDVDTRFTVTVVSKYGCKASDTVSVYLYCNGRQIFLPNVFTPNGDGQNDVFYPRGSGINIVKSFRIYNRWGELLHERTNFQINDINSAWDGMYQGEKCRPDVYVYVTDAVCSTGKPILVKGDITLIR